MTLPTGSKVPAGTTALGIVGLVCLSQYLRPGLYPYPPKKSIRLLAASFQLPYHVFSKERMNRGLKPSISFETFNSHLKQLVSVNKVKRQEESIERSSIVNYSITGAVNCYEYKEMSYLDILKS